jgi:hypothetical protein
MGFNSAFKGLRRPGPTKGCRSNDDDDDESVSGIFSLLLESLTEFLKHWLFIRVLVSVISRLWSGD